MLYEIGKIELKKENGCEFLVLSTRPQDIYEESHSIVVFDECVVNSYKKCIKECGSFEKLPIQWKFFQNAVIVPVQLKNPILVKNDAFGTEYETSVVPMLCKYTVDDQMVANGELSRAITWAPGWSPEERALFYNNRTVIHVPGAEM